MGQIVSFMHKLIIDYETEDYETEEHKVNIHVQNEISAFESEDETAMNIESDNEVPDIQKLSLYDKPKLDVVKKNFEVPHLLANNKRIESFSKGSCTDSGLEDDESEEEKVIYSVQDGKPEIDFKEMKKLRMLAKQASIEVFKKGLKEQDNIAQKIINERFQESSCADKKFQNNYYAGDSSQKSSCAADSSQNSCCSDDSSQKISCAVDSSQKVSCAGEKSQKNSCADDSSQKNSCASNSPQISSCASNNFHESGCAGDSSQKSSFAGKNEERSSCKNQFFHNTKSLIDNLSDDEKKDFEKKTKLRIKFFCKGLPSLKKNLDQGERLNDVVNHFNLDERDCIDILFANCGGGNPAKSLFDHLKQSKPGMKIQELRECLETHSLKSAVDFLKDSGYSDVQSVTDISFKDLTSLSYKIICVDGYKITWKDVALDLSGSIDIANRIAKTIMHPNLYSPTERLIDILSMRTNTTIEDFLDALESCNLFEAHEIMFLQIIKEIRVAKVPID